MNLTKRQTEVFEFVRDRIEAVGESPKLEEIADRFGFSRPRACAIVKAIVDAGALIKRRGWQALALPGGVDLTAATTTQLQAELARRGASMDALEQPRLRMDEGRPCAANHCHNRVRRGHLMCWDHWTALPVEYRNDILRAFRARRAHDYQVAVEAARDYLGGFTRIAERVE